MSNVNNILELGLISSSSVTVLNPCVQLLGGNLSFNEFFYQEIKNGLGLLLGVGAATLLKEYLNVNIPDLNFILGLSGITISGLLEKNNGQNWITGGFLTTGLIGGYFLDQAGVDLEKIMKFIKEGVDFFKWAFETASKVKFPKIPQKLP